MTVRKMGLAAVILLCAVSTGGQQHLQKAKQTPGFIPND